MLTFKNFTIALLLMTFFSACLAPRLPLHHKYNKQDKQKKKKKAKKTHKKVSYIIIEKHYSVA